MKEITKLIQNKRKYFSQPIIKASTIFSKKINKKIKYGLEGNETTEFLENKINILEKSKYTKLFTSGLNAISIIYLTFLKKKDIVYVPHNIYYPNLRVARWLASIIGFKIKTYKKVFSFEKKIKLIWLEVPGSITFEIPNIKKILKISKKKKIITIFDNTYSSSIFKPLKKGFNISIIALTKFYSGNSDILMGSISTNSKSIIKKINRTRKLIGIGVSSEDCYSISRSLFNIKSRIVIHDKSSRLIYSWIKKKYKKIIKKTFFPIKNNFFSKNIKYSSGLFTICFKNINIKKFLENLKIFRIGFSWGGVKSLVMKYKNINLMKGTFIRFYIGLESIKDLKKDIKRSIKISYY